MEVIGRIKVIGPNQDINPTFRKENWLLPPRSNIRKH